MARRKLSIALAPIVAGVGQTVDDEAAVAVLDVAADHLRRFGLAGWSVDDVADAAGVGRDERVPLVRPPRRPRPCRPRRASSARRCSRSATATVAVDRFEDKAVEAALVGLDALDGSVVDHLLQRDPQAILPLLTTGAGPLIALARIALAPALVAAGVATEPAHAAIVAESLARLGLSFVLTRDTVIPVRDPAALRAAVEALLRPLLRPVA